MSPTLTEADEGKDVIDSNGEQIATVARITDGGVLVEPEDGVPSTVRLALGWTGDAPTHRLREPSINVVTKHAVHLRANL